MDRTPEDEREHIEAIYLSHDAFAERTSPETNALQMGEVFRANGMPEPTPVRFARRGLNHRKKVSY